MKDSLNEIGFLHIVALISFGILVSIFVARPEWLSNENDFLNSFVGHEFLGILGVILAITLASLSQAHLSLNRIEEKKGEEIFDETRRELKNVSCWLIGFFVSGFIAVLIKPIVCVNQTAEAIINGFSVFVLLMYVLILTDITTAIFDIKSDVHRD